MVCGAQAASALERAEAGYVSKVEQRKVAAAEMVDAATRTSAQLVVQYMNHVAGVLQNSAAPAPVPAPAPAPPPTQFEQQPQPQQGMVAGGGRGRGMGRGRGAPQPVTFGAPQRMQPPPSQQPAQEYRVSLARSSGGLGMVINDTL